MGRLSPRFCNFNDRDADGLLDGAEVLPYTTNPLVADSDSDGYLDGHEVTAGTGPAKIQ